MSSKKGKNYNYFESFLDKIPAPIYLKDSSGKYLFVNENYKKLSHRTSKDIINKTDYDLFAKEIADLFRGQDEKVIRLESPLDFEETIALPEGAYSFITKKFPLYDGNTSNVSAVGGFCADITEHKKTEKALRESNTQVSLALEIIDAGTWSMDIKSGSYTADERFYEILGYHPEELDNNIESLKNLQHVDGWSMVLEKMFDHFHDRTEQYVYEHSFKHKSGEWRWMLVKAKAIERDETSKKYQRIIGVVIDITDQMKINQQLEKMNIELEDRNVRLYRTQSELERIVEKRTRELKQLNEYLINLEEKERKNIAEEIHDGVSQELAISISKIKVMSKSDSSFKSELTEIQAFLERGLKSIRSLTWQLSPPILYEVDLGIALEWLLENINENYGMDIVYSNEIPEAAKIDESIKVILFRIVRELLINVIRHADTKEVQVDISVENKNIHLQVKDYGIGFDMRRIGEKKFHHFGLFSISERLTSLGGYCKFMSKKGKGTKVFLSSPMTLKED
ncbi:MAG: PAS domain S-box protein [Desulfobacterales bacterium]|nr:PAS domain S-box protein [Desulfobacterales bacterium]MBU8911160.1 PAS domain S-box protein [Desulfobacterales bacterium]